MPLSALPREMILNIASFLDRASLNSLIQVNRGIAILLTPELYDREFPFKTGMSPNVLPHQIRWINPQYSQLPVSDENVTVYQCAMHWQSDIIVEYLHKLPGTVFQRRSRRGNSLLHQIAGAGNTRIFDLLIEKGADLNAVNNSGYIPLHVATLRKDTIIMSRLFDEGADIKTSTRGPGSVVSNAIRIGSLPVIKCVLQGLKTRGKSLDSFDHNITRALSQHISERNWPILMLLFSHGVDLFWKYQRGHRSLFDDIKYIKDDQFFELLLHHCGKTLHVSHWERFLFDVNPLWLSKNTLCRMATAVVVCGGNFEAQRSPTGRTTLHKYAALGCLSGVEILLDQEADVLVTSKDGVTPLMALLLGISHVGRGHSSKAINVDKVAQLLIKAMITRASLNPVYDDPLSGHLHGTTGDMARVTALHIAAEKKEDHILTLLIDNGANVFALDGYGRTPLGRILSIGNKLNSQKHPTGKAAFRKSYENICLILATAMTQQGFDFSTAVPDHIGEPRMSWLELADACGFKLLYEYIEESKL